MNKLTINRTLCIGCKVCFKACFIDVIRWDEEKKQPVVKYPEDCMHCNYCVINCPVRAIKVFPNYETFRFPRESVAIGAAKQYQYLKEVTE